jgi:hypothetical protein
MSWNGTRGGTSAGLSLTELACTRLPLVLWLLWLLRLLALLALLARLPLLLRHNLSLSLLLRSKKLSILVRTRGRSHPVVEDLLSNTASGSIHGRLTYVLTHSHVLLTLDNQPAEMLHCHGADGVLGVVRELGPVFVF